MTGPSVQFIVIAKEPVAGRVKTRLCPPCTPVQAAEIAAASLADTLETVAGTAARLGGRAVLALDGQPGSWVPPSFAVIAQRGPGLADRLSAAFADAFADAPGTPIVLVGMDTPQLTSTHLRAAARSLAEHDAVLGPAPDGGYWSIGFRRPVPDAFVDVPMSRPDTGSIQLARLRACGCDVAELPSLVDVDDIDDARLVAAAVPRSRFANAVAAALGERTPTLTASAGW